MVKAKLNGEYEIVLPKHRADRPEWYTEEGWEKPRLAAFKAEIEKQIAAGRTPKVYYIGAEEGEMCALTQMWGANVLMFEPNERVLPNIKAIWEANNLSPAEFIVGFAGKNATAKPDQRLAQKKLMRVTGEVIHDHGFKELRDPGDIPIYRIDDLVPAGFVSPTIITMDVEGSEWEVLQGAEKTLDTFHPTIFLSLHPEFLINQYDKYSREVRDWIISKGYKETFLDWQHEGHFVYEAE